MRLAATLAGSTGLHPGWRSRAGRSRISMVARPAGGPMMGQHAADAPAQLDESSDSHAPDRQHEAGRRGIKTLLTPGVYRPDPQHSDIAIKGCGD